MIYYPLEEIFITDRVAVSLECYMKFLIQKHVKEFDYAPICTIPILIDFGGISYIVFMFGTEEHKMAVPNNEWKPKKEFIHTYEVFLDNVEDAKYLCNVFEKENVYGMVCICKVDNKNIMYIKINDLLSCVSKTSKIASGGVLFELKKLSQTPNTPVKEWTTITKFLNK